MAAAAGTTESHVEPGRNTNRPGRAPQDTQKYRWCFTLKAQSTSAEPGEPVEPRVLERQLFKILNDHTKEFVFQLERGEGESGYLHFQGCFSLENKERMEPLKNKLGFHTIHLEPCRDWMASKKYCSKPETRIGRTWRKGMIYLPERPLQHIWQQELKRELAGEPHPRKIIWYTDPVGGTGKTTFAVHMHLLDPERNIIAKNGRSADVAAAIGDATPKVVILDLSRTQEDHMNYQVLEDLKNGVIFQSKYKSRVLVFEPPHVVVFANFPPHLSALSADRWDLRSDFHMEPPLPSVSVDDVFSQLPPLGGNIEDWVFE